MTVKKHILFFAAFLCLGAVFAEKHEIVFVAEDGTSFKQIFDNSDKYLVVNAKKFSTKKIAKIEGFEIFSETENVCFYSLRYTGNYDFLKMLPDLKSLGLMNCWISSLDFLENLYNLEDAEIHFTADTSKYDEIKEQKVDLRKLTKLKKIYVEGSDFCEIYEKKPWESSIVQRMDFIPKFVNVQNKPELMIDNNRIEKISKEEIKLLKQYSEVSLDSNPIANNRAELLKLKKAKINFSARPMPERNL